jgi:hypothetical protein
LATLVVATAVFAPSLLPQQWQSWQVSATHQAYADVTSAPSTLRVLQQSNVQRSFPTKKAKLACLAQSTETLLFFPKGSCGTLFAHCPSAGHCTLSSECDRYRGLIVFAPFAA